MMEALISAKVVAKADKYLSEGRLSVLEVSPAEAVVEVTGTEKYRLEFASGHWDCDCPAHTPFCAHIVAAAKVVHLALTAKPGAIGVNDPAIDALLGGPTHIVK